MLERCTCRNMKKIWYGLLVLSCVLVGCSQPAQAVSPASTSAPTSVPTETRLPSTETPTSIPFTLTAPEPTTDPAIFGSIGIGEIQAFALEPIANAIFTKVMDEFKADGNIQEYQVTSVTIFP